MIPSIQRHAGSMIPAPSRKDQSRRILSEMIPLLTGLTCKGSSFQPIHLPGIWCQAQQYTTSNRIDSLMMHMDSSPLNRL